jgi:hypothetical protein
MIRAFYRDAFTLGTPRSLALPDGVTLSDIVGAMPLPQGFADRGAAAIDGHVIERSYWTAVRPKPGQSVTLHMPAAGGGSGKEVLTTVAALALTVATGGIAAGTLLPGLYATSPILSYAAAAAVSYAGSLAISALAPPPVKPAAARRDRGAASASGNVLEANGPVPYVAGTRKIFPPLAFQPLTYYSGQDEVVEAVFALAGPHSLNDIRIDGAALDDIDSVEYELREGWDSDTALTLVTRQAFTAPLQTELTAHQVQEDDQKSLDYATNPDDAYPKWHTAVTRESPDEVMIDLVLPQGLSRNGSDTTKMRIPLRIRMRQKGTTTWRNLPELHLRCAHLRQMRATLRFKWQAAEQSTAPRPAINFGFVEGRRYAPGQASGPATSAWTADSYFYDGAGDNWINEGNYNSATGVLNLALQKFKATFVLAETEWPRDSWEIQVKRGNAFRDGYYSANGYNYNGNDRDFFAHYDSGSDEFIPETREGVADALYMVRCTSIWNEHPVARPGLALIAIKAVNRPLQNVSAMASAYVPDWSGAAWDNWTNTSNPAPHFRHVLAGPLNPKPVPAEIIDDDELVAWRADCTLKDYTVDHISENERIADLLNIIAGCGYARPYASEVWGVARDRDTSADPPVQVFSPRNSAGLAWAKNFAEPPAGLRVNFADAASDYEPNQVLVYREGLGGPNVEQVNYDGLVDEAKIRARAAYDLAQARYRSTFYTLQAPIEAVVCRRGSLVGVQSDFMDSATGSGRIASVQTSGGYVTGVTLDGAVDIKRSDDLLDTADVLAVADMLAVGAAPGCAIRNADGTVTFHALANATGETAALIFETPIVDTSMAGGPFDPATIKSILPGALAMTGNVGREIRRMKVMSVEPGPEMTARITMVDEAQELWPKVPYSEYLAVWSMAAAENYTLDSGRVSVLRNLSPAGSIYDLTQANATDRPTVGTMTDGNPALVFTSAEEWLYSDNAVLAGLMNDGSDAALMLEIVAQFDTLGVVQSIVGWYDPTQAFDEAWVGLNTQNDLRSVREIPGPVANTVDSDPVLTAPGATTTIVVIFKGGVCSAWVDGIEVVSDAAFASATDVLAASRFAIGARDQSTDSNGVEGKIHFIGIRQV